MITTGPEGFECLIAYKLELVEGVAVEGHLCAATLADHLASLSRRCHSWCVPRRKMA
jgi:hypothetical protein